jgi:hypothetical protein
MIHIKKFEDIKIPINVGDTILGGRFKNKKTVVKKIGKNAKGDITVNGKPLLKYRLVKESTEFESFKEETEDLLRSIVDMGFKGWVSLDYISLSKFDINSQQFGVRIYKQTGDEEYSFGSPEFEWDLIRADVQAYIGHMTEEFGYEVGVIYTIGTNAGPSKGYGRLQHEESEILGEKELGMIKCISIEFKK